MYRYIDDIPLERDDVFQKIITKLNDYIENISSKEDKELLLRMVKKVYLNNNKAIKAKAFDDTYLIFSIIIALLIEQSKEIDIIKLQ